MYTLVLKEKITNIPKHITHLYLHYNDNDISADIKWPDNLIFLECYFRPFFGYLPTTIKTLSFVSQRQVLKEELLKNIENVWLTCPNSSTVKFNVHDEFDLYKILASRDLKSITNMLEDLKMKMKTT